MQNMISENGNIGRDRSSQGWSASQLSADPVGMLSDREASFRITLSAANAINFARRHPGFTTVGLMGAMYGAGLAADFFGSANTAHAQTVQPGDLSCSQIDGVKAVQGSPENVVQSFFNDGSISSDRVLSCVGPSGVEQRALDCEGISLAGYGGLNEQSTNQSALCIDNAGALQPVTDGTLGRVRAALHSMPPQPAEAMPTQPVAQVAVATPDPYTRTEQAVNTIKSIPWMILKCWPVPVVGSLSVGGLLWWRRRERNQSNQIAAEANTAIQKAEAERQANFAKNRQAQQEWDQDNPLQGRSPINTSVGSKIDALLDQANLAASEGDPRQRRALLAQALTEAENSHRQYAGGGIGITETELKAIRGTIETELDDHTRRAAGGGYGTGTRRPRNLED